jgi:hypothetical protein
MTPAGLRRAYLESMLDDPGLGLEGFLRRAAAGDFGRFGRQDIVDFLDEVLRDTVASIHARAEAMGASAEEIEERIEERRDALAALAARYAPPP